MAKAEAYFSADGRRLVFQSMRDGRSCDQEYVMNVDGSGLRRVSTGTGKTTCGFFYANDQRILFGSSHAPAVSSGWKEVRLTGAWWENRMGAAAVERTGAPIEAHW